MTKWNISEEAATLHNEALVLDMTMPWLNYLPLNEQVEPLRKMAASGYTFVSLTLAVDSTSLDKTMHIIAKERAYFQANSDKYILVETADDIRLAKLEGKLAIGFHFQGTNPINSDLNMVETYYKLGVRHMLMAYNKKNDVGDGCSERTDGGLTRFGVALVEEMNRVGMLVDVSHTGYRTSMDVFEVSPDPVVFSHANPLALWDTHRNIRDDQIKACAKSGGVIGFNGCGTFLGDNITDTETMLRHIDYLVELVGPQHVGIGLDHVSDPMALAIYMGADWGDTKFADPEQLPEITEGLLKRGYSETNIRGILGENWIDLAQRVWK
jgi:membrane dipeptidase